MAKPHRPTLSPEAAGRLRKVSSGGSRDALAAAVIAGLMRFPDQVHRHADALSHFAGQDAKVGPAIDSLLEAAEMLEPGDNSPISHTDANAAPPDQTRFAFLGEGQDPQVARDELAEAVSLLVERPALEAALAAATARFETDPEGAYAEQQRLLKRKLDFEERLRHMASKRAARAALTDSERSAEPAPANEETD